jgi:hypothetical protein
MNTSVKIETQAIGTEISALPVDAKLTEVIAKLNEVITKVNVKRDRGPDSTRTMTEDDAKAIMLGEHKGLSHTAAAEKLGLSYGQVYSARKGFTFKTVYQEAQKAARK